MNQDRTKKQSQSDESEMVDEGSPADAEQDEQKPGEAKKKATKQLSTETAKSPRH